MTPQEIMVLGYNQHQPEEPLNMVEQLLWFQTALLSDSFKHGVITKERATELKLHYLAQYNANSTRLHFLESAERYNGKLLRQLESFMNAFALNPCIENAKALYEAVYDLKVKEGDSNQENSDN